MKRFGSLVLAAVLGSVCTVASFEWLNKNQKEVKLNYLSTAPTSKVAFRVNEDGKAVPVDFTAAAAQVMPGVVFIKSTQEGQPESESEIADPFREFLDQGVNRDLPKVQARGLLLMRVDILLRIITSFRMLTLWKLHYTIIAR